MRCDEWAVLIVLAFCCLVSLSLLGTDIYIFYRYPAENGMVHGTFVVFLCLNLCLRYVFQTVYTDKKKYNHLILNIELSASLLAAILIEESLIRIIFISWSVFTTIYIFVLIITKVFHQYWYGKENFSIQKQTLSEFIDEQMNTDPQITIRCKAFRPKSIWKFWQSKEVIGNDAKIFVDYENCIDLTDQSSIEGYKKTWQVIIDFKIDFEEQIETLYFRTSQQFIDDFRKSLLQEYQEDSEITVKYDISFSRQNKTVICLKNESLEMFLWILGIPGLMLEGLLLFDEKCGSCYFTKRITIQKKIS
ncbi:uncharacterized protein [Clytia hemisphaerica]|uniref:Transmembrane protein n=1 Tax=Clytia hemisphaerica TaxID=252671 RepID=A0A7M5V9U4_9CNID